MKSFISFVGRLLDTGLGMSIGKHDRLITQVWAHAYLHIYNLLRFLKAIKLIRKLWTSDRFVQFGPTRRDNT